MRGGAVLWYAVRSACGYILAYDAMLYEVAVPCFMQCDAMLNAIGLDEGVLVAVWRCRPCLVAALVVPKVDEIILILVLIEYNRRL